MPPGAFGKPGREINFWVNPGSKKEFPGTGYRFFWNWNKKAKWLSGH